MIESIEGKRGLPRHRPPYVAEVGLFGRPTLVQNVETLFWVTRICREGPEVMTAHSWNGRTRPAQLLRLRPGGACPGSTCCRRDRPSATSSPWPAAWPPGHAFKAYQPGGPSSGLLPARLDTVPLDFDTLQPHGTFIGSAAVVVLSDQDSARAAALNMLALLRRRELRPVHALPGRLRQGGAADAGGALGQGAPRRALPGHGRRQHLRPRPGGAERDPPGHAPLPRRNLSPPRRAVNLIFAAAPRPLAPAQEANGAQELDAGRVGAGGVLAAAAARRRG